MKSLLNISILFSLLAYFSLPIFAEGGDEAEDKPYVGEEITKPEPTSNVRCLPFSLSYRGPGKRNVWIGATFPKDVRDKLEQVQNEIKKTGLRGGSYEAPGRLHVSLKFLGSIDQSPEPVEAIANALKTVPAIPLNMKITKIGILNNKNGTAKLIWAEISSDSLHQLFGKIEDTMLPFCKRDLRAYKPHITLYRFGRHNGPLPQKLQDAIKSISPNIESFALKGFKFIESPQIPSDPYKALAKYPGQTSLIVEEEKPVEANEGK
jgi:2'-5' RNA ligase